MHYKRLINWYHSGPQRQRSSLAVRDGNEMNRMADHLPFTTKRHILPKIGFS